MNLCVPPYPEAQRAMWPLLGLPGRVHRSEAVHVPGQSCASDLAAQGEISMITTHATLARAGRHRCARNQHCHKSPSGSAPPHGLQVAGERGLIGAAKGLAQGVVALRWRPGTSSQRSTSRTTSSQTAA